MILLWYTTDKSVSWNWEFSRRKFKLTSCLYIPPVEVKGEVFLLVLFVDELGQPCRGSRHAHPAPDGGVHSDLHHPLDDMALNQEITHWSPDPFHRERAGSGHKTRNMAVTGVDIQLSQLQQKSWAIPQTISDYNWVVVFTTIRSFLGSWYMKDIDSVTLYYCNGKY